METLPFTALDLVVGIIVLISALVAFSKGAVRETLNLASWIGAFAVAIYGYSFVKPLLSEAIGNELLTDVATLAVAFFVPLIVFRIIAGMIAGALDDSGLGTFDKLAGLFLGLARGAAIAIALYMIGSFFVPPPNQPEWVQTAQVTPYLEQGATVVRRFLPQDLEEKGESAAQATAREAEKLRKQAGEIQRNVQGYDEQTRESLEQLIEGERRQR